MEDSREGEEPGPVVLEGWVRKRGKRSIWRERYFLLRGTRLEMYVRRGDMDPRRIYELPASCIIGKITHVQRRRGDLYEFSIRWPQAEEASKEEVERQARPSEDFVEDESDMDGDEMKDAEMVPAGQASGEGSGGRVAVQRRTGHGGSGANPRVVKLAEQQYETEKRLQRQRQASHADEDCEGTGRRRSKKKNRAGTAAKMAAVAAGGVVVGVLTFGIGLAVTGLVVVGVSAAAGGGSAIYAAKHLERGLYLGFETAELAEEWRAAMEAQVQWAMNSSSNTWSATPSGLISFGGKLLSIKADAPPPAEIKLARVGTWTHNTQWEVCRVEQGLRIFEDAAAPKNANLCTRKAAMVVKGTPLKAFTKILSVPPGLRNGLIESVRIVETIDDHADVIHLKLRTIFVAPSWTTPRDFCLMRYWRLDDDGVYIICYDSMEHRECPPEPAEAFVRGEMHAMYTIAPLNESKNLRPGEPTEALVTHVVQVDPKGWIFRSGGFVSAFADSLLMHLFDLRDHLEEERFAAIDVEPAHASSGHNRTLSGSVSVTDVDASGSAAAAAGGFDAARRRTTIGLESSPAPFNMNMWREPDSKTFNVRGANYLEDRLKFNAGSAQFRLVSVDVLEWSNRVPQNVCAHPRNRVAMAYEKVTGKPYQAAYTNEPADVDPEVPRVDPSEQPKPEDCPDGLPWLFVLHIMIPGPPNLSFAAYFTPVDPNWHAKETPFANVANPFFFGGDDEFCDNTFKLIPKIVEGNFVVRRVVGSTPAVLGTKLKQYYHRAPHYFELDVDIGSSSVAAGVVRLSLGYATTITVDMGFVLEGKKEADLPEAIMGCVQCCHIDLSLAKFIE